MSINLAVFASGSGTTLQAIIDSIENKKLDCSKWYTRVPMIK